MLEAAVSKVTTSGWGATMAIGVLLEFPGATREQYEYTVKKLLKGRRNKLADWPTKGVLAHMAGPMSGGWRVVDVWQSEAAFKRFGKLLLPILKEAGLPEVEPKIFPLVRFVRD
jgi:hypothetical protein